MGVETIVILTTMVVISNTIVMGVNTKAVTKCMEVIADVKKY